MGSEGADLTDLANHLPVSLLTTPPAAPLLQPAVPPTLLLLPQLLPVLQLQPLTLPVISLQLELPLLLPELVDLLHINIYITVNSMLLATVTSMIQALA